MSESPTPKIRAGEALADILATDPNSQAAWKRAQAKLLILSLAVESTEFKRLRAAERRQVQELIEELQARVKAAGDQLEEYQFPRPDTLEDWIELGRIAEIPEADIREASASEISDRALAWAKRQTIRARLASSAAPDRDSLRIPESTNGSPTRPTKTKRSTQRGEGRIKLIAALTKHHQYANGGCLNLEPVGNNELARMAKVANRTASAFFAKEFQGYEKYRVLCNDAPRLVAALKSLNGEFRPSDFYDVRKPSDLERDED